VVQGTAADIIKTAMTLVSAFLDGEAARELAGVHAGGVRGRLVLQVHDELLLEAPAEDAAALVAAVRRIMVEDVPVEVARIARAGLFSGVSGGGGGGGEAARALLGGTPLLRVPLQATAECGTDWGHMV